MQFINVLYQLIDALPSAITIHQLDQGWVCKLPTRGFDMKRWDSFPAFSIVKTPVHLASEVMDVDGHRVSPFYRPSVAEPLSNHKRNISETIVGWRVMLVMTLGCVETSKEGQTCDGKECSCDYRSLKQHVDVTPPAQGALVQGEVPCMSLTYRHSTGNSHGECGLAWILAWHLGMGCRRPILPQHENTMALIHMVAGL